MRGFNDHKLLINMFFLWHFLLYAHIIYSEAFGNNSLNIPKFGMAFFDNVIIPHKKVWGLNHQYTVGTSFMQAIDYRWWWVAETAIGFGHLSSGYQPHVSTFFGGGGVRLNIFQDDVRPHMGLTLHYLQFLGDSAKALPLNLGWPIFVGLKPYMGIEWLFYSEMALMLDGGLGLYVNINEPFRQVLYANLAFAFYF